MQIHGFEKWTIILFLAFIIIGAGTGAFAPTVRAESFEEIRNERVKKYLQSVKKYAQSQPPEKREQLIANAEQVVAEGLRELESPNYDDFSPTQNGTPDLNVFGNSEELPALARAEEFLRNQFPVPSRTNQLIAQVVPFDFGRNDAVLFADRSSSDGNPFSILGNVHHSFSGGIGGGSNSVVGKNGHKSIGYSHFVATEPHTAGTFRGSYTGVNLSSFTLIAQTVVRRE